MKLRDLFKKSLWVLEPRPDRPAPKRIAVVIPGAFLHFCDTCFIGVSTFQQPNEKCPWCHGTLRYVATSLRAPMEPPAPRRPFLRPKVTPHDNLAAFLTDPRDPKAAA